MIEKIHKIRVLNVNKLQYVFQTKLILNGKEVKGTFEANERGMKFRDASKAIVDKSINWCEMEWKVRTEIATLLFVVKKEKKY